MLSIKYDRLRLRACRSMLSSDNNSLCIATHDLRLSSSHHRSSARYYIEQSFRRCSRQFPRSLPQSNFWVPVRINLANAKLSATIIQATVVLTLNSSKVWSITCWKSSTPRSSPQWCSSRSTTPNIVLDLWLPIWVFGEICTIVHDITPQPAKLY